jgi:hypothetical protein
LGDIPQFSVEMKQTSVACLTVRSVVAMFMWLRPTDVVCLEGWQVLFENVAFIL